VNTRGYVEHFNDKSATGCNISTYLGLVSNTTKRDALEWTCFDREREREVFPVPDGPITRSIRSLIDNERGSESGADDKS